MKASLLFLCALCISLSSAGYPTFKQQSVEVWSDWYFVSFTLADDTSLSVTISASPTDIDISPSTLHFTTDQREASFRLKPRSQGTYTITFTLSDESAPYIDYVYSNLRIVSLDYWPGDDGVYINYPYEPVQFRLNQPSLHDLEITPDSDTGSVIFEPSTIKIPAGAIAAPFRLTATVNEYSTISFDIVGEESSLYGELADRYIYYATIREIYVDDLSNYALVGHNSTVYYAYTKDAVNKSVTVTPHAVDTVFSPETFEFTPTTRVVPFTFISSTPAYGNRNFYFDLSGPGSEDYTLTTIVAAGLKKRLFTVQYPTEFVLNRKTYISIRVSAPPASSVSLYLYAANMVFTPTNITFSGTITSITVEVLPRFEGPDQINYLVDGPEKDWFTTPALADVQVIAGSFFSPNSWYVPALWVGVESPKIPVRVSLKPDTNVTLIPQAPDLVFNPTKLTFTASSQQQFFTITPGLINNDNLNSGSSVSITWIVEGGDYLSFTTPSSINVYVSRRDLQLSWSVHVEEDDYQLYLKKTYDVWAIVTYGPPEELTVVPVNPHITFSPTVLKFTSGTTHVKFTATVDNPIGETAINFILGGKNGAYYTTPEPVWVYATIRPFALYDANIAPDDRVKTGVTINTRQGYNVEATIQENHVYNIGLRSNVIPENGFTVTPRSHHVTFDPVSFDLTPDTALITEQMTVYSTVTYATGTRGNIAFYVPTYYVEANFSVTPQAPGIHEVWFELSGPDSDYYDIPDHLWLYFSSEMRPPTEFPESAASYVSISILGLVLSVLLVLM